MKSTVSRDGRITIDQRARRALGVQPGMVAVQLLVQGHLEVHFIPPEHDESLFGVLAVPPGTEIPPWDVIEERMAEAIAEDALRRVSPWLFADDQSQEAGGSS
jgi:hypothetical protein